MSRQVLITGAGLVTPNGVGTRLTWQNLLAGRSGIRRVTRFDATRFACQVAGEVPEWHPERLFTPRKRKELGPFIELALVAAQLAVDDARLLIEPPDRERAGCSVGVAVGGPHEAGHWVEQVAREGPSVLPPLASAGWNSTFAGSQIAMAHGLRGPNLVLNAACASGGQAVGEAFKLIQAGRADLMLAGGTDAGVSPISFAGFEANRGLVTRFNDSPHLASRPFAADRDGFVIGEGAGFLVLEEAERARRRGARAYAELAGYASTCDAFHITQPGPDGAARTMRAALVDAQLAPTEVGYVNAHAAGTLMGDLLEVAAVREVFGPHADRLLVSATKSMVGHLMGAAGAVEAAVTALSLHECHVHPTLNCEQPGRGCDLDFVARTSRRVELQAALSNSFGLGGINTCLAMKRAQA